MRPGEYLVAAPAPTPAAAARNEAMHPTAFYPAARTSLDATPMHISAGDVRDGGNFTVPLGTSARALTLSGKLIGQDTSIGFAIVRLIPAESTDVMAGWEAQWTQKLHLILLCQIRVI